MKECPVERETLVVRGGTPLRGEVTVSGAKNSVLPLLAACLLSPQPCLLENCPRITDVECALRILEHLGCAVQRDGHRIEVDASHVTDSRVPDPLMRGMRSSIMFLGAILARTGQAELTYPGGCELGPRPIDLHLEALKKLGASVEEQGGRLTCRGKLYGRPIMLAFPSVGATENVMLAACTAVGETTLINAAREPEIVDLQHFLNAMGARISGAGSTVIRISGVPAQSLHGTSYRVMPDRIEAGTYLMAAAATGGEVTLRRVQPLHMEAELAVLERMGLCLTRGVDLLTLRTRGRPAAAGKVVTGPYPGFPTDLQAVLTGLLTVSQGTSLVVETVFKSRFHHAGELLRLGADLHCEGNVCVVQGVERLTGACLCAADLRGAAGLLVAALAAEGTSRISQSCYIRRGYEDPEEKIASLGGFVEREWEHGTKEAGLRQA